MDCINRSQLDCAKDSIITIDAPLLKCSYSAVLVRSITIRHLPPITRQMPCAITLTVNGSTFTTPSQEVQVEDDEDTMNEIDEITGNAISTMNASISSKTRKMNNNTNSAMSSRVGTANNNNNNNNNGTRMGSRCGTGNSSTRPYSSSSSYRQAAVKFLYKFHCDSLNVLFPGVRIPAREQGNPREDIVIDDPRAFTPGITVQVHSVDYSQIYGSTLVTFSGERAYLSYPRGEVKVAFRVYPCVHGMAQMTPLYNKHSLALTYLQGYTEDMAALTEQYSQAASVCGEPAAKRMNADECESEKGVIESDAAAAVAVPESTEQQQEEEEYVVNEAEQYQENINNLNEEVDAMVREIEEEAIAAHCQQMQHNDDNNNDSNANHENVLQTEDANKETCTGHDKQEQQKKQEPEENTEPLSSSSLEYTSDTCSKEQVIMTDVDGQRARAKTNEQQENTDTSSQVKTMEVSECNGHADMSSKCHLVGNTKKPVANALTPESLISIDGDPLTSKVLSLIPCIYEQNRKAAFHCYDTKGTGFITREQLLHFCRAHVPLADLYKDASEPQTNNETVLMEYCQPYLPPWPPRESHELHLMNNNTEGDDNSINANQGEEGNEVITSRRAPTPRVNPDYLYCRPATPSPVATQPDMNGVNGTRSMRLGENNEMLIPYNIFSLIALKLARM